MQERLQAADEAESDEVTALCAAAGTVLLSTTLAARHSLTSLWMG